MGSSSGITSLALVCLTLLAVLHSSHGQNSPQDYLNAHNSARSAVGVGPMTWDANVAAFAQQYANQRVGDCALQHSGGGGKYGENLAKGSGDFTGAAAVGLWVGEKPDYNYNSNTCAAGKVSKDEDSECREDLDSDRIEDFVGVTFFSFSDLYIWLIDYFSPS
ncbi:hypothetical protein RHGRI_032502 [Rhododendron griersonianum]|uniref:SCP domain-containing protein n=1 Tax=Rhododendron griersonianum TaxID=479676 RepID=A0AAV6IED9_9ERIC|nr:hypothetical protein RHGRI_032502 [Rhododendron griersonianum]